MHDLDDFMVVGGSFVRVEGRLEKKLHDLMGCVFSSLLSSSLEPFARVNIQVISETPNIDTLMVILSHPLSWASDCGIP